MTNYIFYKIAHPNFPLLNYIGSTKNFHKRKIQYKTSYNNPKQSNYNCKLYKFIRDNNINFQSLNFSIITQFNLKSKEHARKYERYLQ